MIAPPTMMARALALQEYLREAHACAFEWGRFDCVNFAAGWVALARPDLALERFERANALQAARQIRRRAGGIGCAGGLRESVCTVLGAPVSPLLAQIGDLVLLPTLREQARRAQGRPAGRLGYTLGICVGSMIAAPTRQGLIYMPMAAREPGRLDYLSAGEAAWHV